MTFDEASDHVLMVGKEYLGMKLRDIADTDQGLLRLDWIVGQQWCRGRTRDAIATYLAHPDVARRLDAILED